MALGNGASGSGHRRNSAFGVARAGREPHINVIFSHFSPESKVITLKPASHYDVPEWEIGEQARVKFQRSIL